MAGGLRICETVNSRGRMAMFGRAAGRGGARNLVCSDAQVKAGDGGRHYARLVTRPVPGGSLCSILWCLSSHGLYGPDAKMLN